LITAARVHYALRITGSHLVTASLCTFKILNFISHRYSVKRYFYYYYYYYYYYVFRLNQKGKEYVSSIYRFDLG